MCMWNGTDEFYTMTFSDHLEDLTEQLGGCGLFQWLSCFIISCASFVWNWSMIQMSFIGQHVGFWCKSMRIHVSAIPYLNESSLNVGGKCNIDDIATCNSFVFHNSMNTAVSEWALVCDRKWVIAVITTLQMVGLVTGTVCGGQFADTFGRKPTLVIGVVLCTVFNAIGYLASSWEAYAAVRSLIGLGIGLSMAVQYPLLIEFVPSKLRSAIVSFPCEPIAACIFALVCWSFYNWRKIHLFTGCVGLAFLFALLFVPESVRWLVTKQKFNDARQVISVIAKVNRVIEPDLTPLFLAAETELGARSQTKIHSVFSLFKSEELYSTTLRLSFLWFAVSCSFFGLTLGVKGLSANIYLGIVLINIVDVPSSASTGPFLDWCGRKRFLIVVFLISGVFSCVSGGLQHFSLITQLETVFLHWASGGQVYSADFFYFNSIFDVQGVISTLIALVGKATCTSAFNAVIIYTSEIYPTEIRTLGYGFSSAVGRIGTIVAPNVILLDDYIPGILYISSGVMMVMSAFVILPLKETRNTGLKDSVAQM